MYHRIPWHLLHLAVTSMETLTRVRNQGPTRVRECFCRNVVLNPSPKKKKEKKKEKEKEHNVCRSTLLCNIMFATTSPLASPARALHCLPHACHGVANLRCKPIHYYMSQACPAPPGDAGQLFKPNAPDVQNNTKEMPWQSVPPNRVGLEIHNELSPAPYNTS